ncbi:MAG: anthranilate synthase component I family protein [Bacteroidia bacterium]
MERLRLLHLLHWADRYPYFYFCLQNNPQDELSLYRWVMGMGRQVAKYPFKERGWYMGGWSYEWKAPYKKPWLEFPKVAFFVPQVVIAQSEASEWCEEDLSPPTSAARFLASSFDRQGYVEAVERIRALIRNGEVYQINLTLALLWEVALDPLVVYVHLLRAWPSTFNYIFKYQQKYLIGASPERFFWQWRQLVVQQPIKGTISRGKTWEEDLRNLEFLRRSPKETAENTMIVDLVRNDLQRVCLTGSVQVPALAEVHTFPTVHHLVSTVVGERAEGVSTWEVVESLFPAGSMTGAPKKAALRYIYELEPIGRGLYSGAVGYLSPEGEADFAVVIRSCVYDRASRRLLIQVGSGITYDSDPLAEWEESWLKADHLLRLLGLPTHGLRS